jgi:hypothetical protein
MTDDTDYMRGRRRLTGGRTRERQATLVALISSRDVGVSCFFFKWKVCFV